MFLAFGLVLLLSWTSVALAAKFPPDNFALGFATSAYQIEGAVDVDGRGRTIWDDFIAAGNILDGSNAEQVANSYTRYPEDVRHIASLGANTYSITLSWARIIPLGDGPVEPRGLDYYRRVIRELKANNISVWCTLYHWELPSALQEKGGWLNRDAVVEPLAKYARVVFEALAQEGVSLFASMNEPRTFCFGGYTWGDSPPGRCSDRTKCKEGDGTTEPHICGHHALLAHAAIAKIWREEFAAAHPNTQFGIVLDGEWVEPLTNSAADIEAARRERVFIIGQFAHPIWIGDYPPEMKASMGSKLPTFTAEEIASIKGSSDFFAWDYYTATYAYDTLKGATCNTSTPWWPSCSGSTLTGTDGKLIGPVTGHPFFYTYPEGLRKGLKYLSDTYNPPSLIITENGHAVLNESTLPASEKLKDPTRIDSMLRHISALRESVELDDVNVVGYFAWSLLDNFEWKYGTTIRFGVVHVDFENNATRSWKDSAYAYCEVAKEILGKELACLPPRADGEVETTSVMRTTTAVLPQTASKSTGSSSVAVTSRTATTKSVAVTRTTIASVVSTAGAQSTFTSSRPSAARTLSVSSQMLFICVYAIVLLL
jgi:beta-glucosidase